MVFLDRKSASRALKKKPCSVLFSFFFFFCACTYSMSLKDELVLPLCCLKKSIQF